MVSKQERRKGDQGRKRRFRGDYTRHKGQSQDQKKPDKALPRPRTGPPRSKGAGATDPKRKKLYVKVALLSNRPGDFLFSGFPSKITSRGDVRRKKLTDYQHDNFKKWTARTLAKFPKRAKREGRPETKSGQGKSCGSLEQLIRGSKKKEDIV